MRVKQFEYEGLPAHSKTSRPALVQSAQKYPAASFFVLALGITWFCLAFITLVQRGILSRALLPLAALLVLVAKFGPTLAGLVMTRVVFGSRGLKALRERLFLWRVGFRYYLFVLVVPLVLGGLALAGFRVLGGQLPSVSPDVLVLALVTLLLKAFAGGGLGEELGWRGFALPVLLPRLGRTWSSVLIGGFWAVWHWPALLLNGTGIGEILGFSVAVVALAFIFTWLHIAAGGSLLLVVLFHAAFNTPPAVLDRLSPGLSDSTPFSFSLYAALLLLTLAVVIFGKPARDRCWTTTCGLDPRGEPSPNKAMQTDGASRRR